MDKVKESNYAFIDAANLHKGIKSLHWQLDYQRSILEAQKEKAPDEDGTS
jgi:hypothetical protein